MKTFFNSLLVLAGAMLFSQTFNVQSGSKANWIGYKLAKTESSSHNGNIPISSGSLIAKEGTISAGNFTASVKNLVVEDLTGDMKGKLEGHLKNQDFFEVEKYPTATFKITKVSKSKSKTYPLNIVGNMTVKGITQSISFNAVLKITKNTAKFISEKFTIDRKKFGIEYDSSMKDMVIKDEVDLQVILELKK